MNEVTRALSALRAPTMSWPDYADQVKAGKLADPGRGSIMPDFEAAHPEHPLIGKQRFPRMAAADALRDVARGRREPFPPDVLAGLHICLLDCCAAVRLSLAEALYYAGDDASIAALTELVRLEADPDMPGRSAAVRRYANAALGRCKARGDGTFPSDRPLLLALINDIDLAADLMELAAELGLHVHHSSTAIDLIALTPAVQVVEVAACTPAAWDGFAEYLDQCMAGDEPDDTPLMLVNHRQEGLPRLAKPKGTVLGLGVGCSDLVADRVRQVIATAPLAQGTTTTNR